MKSFNKYNVFAKFVAVTKSSELLDLGRRIDSCWSFVVVTHTHPDGDALGSSSALCRYLRQLGKEKVAVVREDAPRTIAFIAEGDPLLQGDDALEAIAGAQMILCTDFNGLSRAGAYGQAIAESKAYKVLFDHHLNPQMQEFDLVFSTPEVSSACEVVYSVLKALPHRADFSSGIGDCLMAGMTTDTNNFANSVYPDTLVMASELIRAGVDRDSIVAKLYNRYRKNRVLAISHILSEHMQLREDGLAVLTVSKELWHRFGLEEGELEGMVNIPLSIDEVKVCIYLRESEDEPVIRASIRSKKGWSANRIAAAWFNGGGHEQASGGKLRIPEDIASMDQVGALIEKITI